MNDLSTSEGWAQLTLSEQVLQIAREAESVVQVAKASDNGQYRIVYERVMRMVDLTLEANHRRYELSIWRACFAEYYTNEPDPPDSHCVVLRCLLQLSPESDMRGRDLYNSQCKDIQNDSKS